MSRSDRITSSALLLLTVIPAWSRELARLNSDSILYVLISLDHWTPFYWGQARIGMLFPFLARWVHDYFWNLLFQSWLHALCLFGVFWTSDRFVQSDSRNRAARVASALFLLAILVPVNWKTVLVIWLLTQPYIPSLFFLLSSVLFLREGSWPPIARYGLCSILLFLSIWVNDTAMLYGIAIGLLGAFFWGRRMLVLSLASVLCFAVIRFWQSRTATPVPLELSPPQTWMYTTKFMLAQLGDVASPWLFWLLLLTAGVIAWFRRSGRVGQTWIVFTGAALAGIAAITVNKWVLLSQNDIRYWTLSLVLLIASAVTLLVNTLWETARLSRFPNASSIATLALLAGMLVYRFGLPFPESTRSALKAAMGRHDAALVSAGCTHFAGNYWEVWTAVFWRKAVDPGHPLRPVASRAAAFRGIPVAEPTWCALCDDPEAIEQTRAAGAPVLQKVPASGGICRLVPQVPDK